MEKRPAFPEAYQYCLAAEKLQGGIREVIVSDRDGCIQPFPHPVEEVPGTVLSANKEMRELAEGRAVFVESSAQVAELAMTGDAYDVSVDTYGFKRGRPNIRMPDGKIVHRPDEVPEWKYLHNPDAFLGFGSGVYLRWNGGYVQDMDFHKALGGDEWRPRFFERLAELEKKYPYIDFQSALGVVDKKRLKRNPDADVDPLDFRVQFDQGALEDRARLLLTLMSALLGCEFVDESNPLKQRFTTYAVAELAQKHLVLERFGTTLANAAEVPIGEITFNKIGDSPTDLLSGLVAFQGAKEVNLIIAAGSRLSRHIVNNKCEFAGMPLPGSSEHPLVRGIYHPTDVPGVYMWERAEKRKGASVLRRVVVADYTPFAEGLGCAESVLVCLKYLWYGPKLRP